MRCPPGGRLTLATHVADHAVGIDVADTGVGMDDEARARLFEPYFSTRAAGTGLGLTIAKRNVELNNGTIEVESAPGTGTTVRLRFPIEAERYERSRASQPGVGSTGRRRSFVHARPMNADSR